MKTELIKSAYIEVYKKKQPISILKHLNKLKEKEFNSDSFGYFATISSVYSSMIEGNMIDLDTYLKYNSSGMNTKSKNYREIEDLKDAYEFAHKHELTKANLLKAHSILSKTFITDKKYCGKIRDKGVSVFGGGIKVYEGASALIVNNETDKLFNDIAILLKMEMSVAETFYYASMIHLVFAKIHPFADGNGRSARLLEKWFLAEKLENKAWFIPSERLYQTRLKSYYKNIDIGLDYTNLDFDLCIPFLLMLPMALKMTK